MIHYVLPWFVCAALMWLGARVVSTGDEKGWPVSVAYGWSGWLLAVSGPLFLLILLDWLGQLGK